MSRSFDNLARRVMLLANKGVLQTVNDKFGRQFAQIKAFRNEVRDKVERMQEYGFSSHPKSGAQVLLLSLGGNRDNPIITSIDDPRYRPKNLKEGEVCLYTDEGDRLIFKRGRKIEIETLQMVVKASEKILFDTPEFECTGNITDRVDLDGKSMDDMRETYDDHTHTGDSGGTTSTPHQKMEDS